MDEGTTLRGWIRFYVTCYYPARLRWFWHETLPFTLASWLPRKLALFAFIRVYGVLGECTPDYIRVCGLWTAQSHRPAGGNHG